MRNKRGLMLCMGAGALLAVLFYATRLSPPPDPKCAKTDPLDSRPAPAGAETRKEGAPRITPRRFVDRYEIRVVDRLRGDHVPGVKLLGADDLLIATTGAEGSVLLDHGRSPAEVIALQVALASGVERISAASADQSESDGIVTFRIPRAARIRLRTVNRQPDALGVNVRVLDYPVIPANANLPERDVERLEFNALDPDVYLDDLGALGLRRSPFVGRHQLTVPSGTSLHDLDAPFRGRAVVKLSERTIVSPTALVELEPGQVVEVALDLKAAPIVSGIIVDDSGRALPGVRVRVTCRRRVEQGEFLARSADEQLNAAFGIIQNRLDRSITVFADKTGTADVNGAWSVRMPFTESVIAYAHQEGRARCQAERSVPSFLDDVPDVEVRCGPKLSTPLTMSVIDQRTRAIIPGVSVTMSRESPIDPWHLEIPVAVSDQEGRVDLRWLEPVEYRVVKAVDGGGKRYLGGTFHAVDGGKIELTRQ